MPAQQGAPRQLQKPCDVAIPLHASTHATVKVRQAPHPHFGTWHAPQAGAIVDGEFLEHMMKMYLDHAVGEV